MVSDSGPSTKASQYDVAIVGGGVAGLSAALVLGRCCRRVLLCSSGERRNASAEAVHGFLTRDGIKPAELIRVSFDQLAAYKGVRVREARVLAAARDQAGFVLRLGTGRKVTCRRLLIASGVVDELPPIPGIRELYGRSIFHCPYCDGWEVRHRRILIYGDGEIALTLIQTLRCWSRMLFWCTPDSARSTLTDQRVSRWGIKVYTENIGELEVSDGKLTGVRFLNGERLRCEAIFFANENHQRSDLAAQLGCRQTSKGLVKANEVGLTSEEGVYVAGDAKADVQLAIIAAGEGAKAAYAINKSLIEAEHQ